jgi:hypothetical protein
MHAMTIADDDTWRIRVSSVAAAEPAAQDARRAS